jgi:hypothetical protein
MSDHYMHKSVTITPQPGGYYELSHPGLPEPIRERGKEKAEQRAEEIAATFDIAGDDSHMVPQGDIPDAVIEAPRAPEPAPGTMSFADVLAQNTAMMQQMQAMQARIEELAAAGVRTVQQTEGEPEQRLVAPNHYAGEMDPTARKVLEAKGHKILKIILEENESIPPTGLFLGHNGKSYMIQPGVPVDVPDFLVGVLDNAVMSAPVVDSKSQKVVGYRDRLKYGYRRVD